MFHVKHWGKQICGEPATLQEVRQHIHQASRPTACPDLWRGIRMVSRISSSESSRWHWASTPAERIKSTLRDSVFRNSRTSFKIIVRFGHHSKRLYKIIVRT